MSEPAPLNAMFFAFRKREERFVLTRITVGYLIGYALICAAYIAAVWPSLAPMSVWYFDLLKSAGAGGDMAPMPDVFGAIWPFIAASFVLNLVLFAAYEAACLRWLVRGEHGGGLLGLTFGADTGRTLGTYFVWMLLFVVFIAGVGALYVGLRALGEAHESLRIVTLLLAALAPLALIAVFILFVVRLAPAAATSVSRGKFAFFGAWGITRSRFWALLGAFFILVVGYLVITMIVGQIMQIPIMQHFTPIVQDAMRGVDSAELAERTRVLMNRPEVLAFGIANFVVSTVLSCVYYVAMFGVNARAVLAAQEESAPVSA